MEFKKLSDWGLGLPQSGSLIVAGPCSVESQGQMMRIGNELKDLDVHILRAGIWKPRSRPGSFQGVGLVGLEWLKEASLLTKIPCATEVATPQHVEQALNAGIDILWIGARTTVNPFYVQEIAEALKGIDIPVMVKNPINPDLELWIGSIERLYQVGIRSLMAIHRGFSTFKATTYRNPPMWEIPIELRRRFPTLPVICDPSHIAGNDLLVPEISQKALDLDFNGLMIEVHDVPDKAKSDADQQLTPKQLKSLLSELIYKSSSIKDIDFIIRLDALRSQIDGFDREIINLLAKRMNISKEIGIEKTENDVTFFQMDRWAQLFLDRVKATVEAGLSEQFAKDFIQSIHKESIRQQMEGIKKDTLLTK